MKKSIWLTILPCLLYPTFAFSQIASVEQRVAMEMGQCVLQRSGLAAENDALKARIAALEKKLADSEKSSKEGGP